jgi:hypothetical protein
MPSGDATDEAPSSDEAADEVLDDEVLDKTTKGPEA